MIKKTSGKFSDSPRLTDVDPWLEPFANHLAGRQAYIEHKSRQILAGAQLQQFALGYLYFGLHKDHERGVWIFREWAPNATKIYLTGDMTNWEDVPEFELARLEHDIWEVTVPIDAITHKDHYKLHVFWAGGDGLRIPSYTSYATQDESTKDFSATVWQPEEPFIWTDEVFTPPSPPPLIYEAHVGMSSENPKVASYKEFTDTVLPRIKKAGYNTVQLMAIQEHPYYGSFGYHVSNFFAVSSRFGTPDDFKLLVNTAHELGLRVIIDLVHSHAVKNEAEGLSNFDGSSTQYFHAGSRGSHKAWDSRVFDYGKPEVVHFLLSNIQWWLNDYHIDGFRFDGVTSMLYFDHGLEKAFTGYADYFGANIDQDALTYLTLANQLIHELKPSALSIAEDMSGFPGLAWKYGTGFDYRLSMGVPDLWIKLLKEQKDEEWNLGRLFHELTTKRPEERVISYAESHDQALVGDKTLIFRLIDKNMYEHMQISDDDLLTERGIALHKMIRLLTASLNGGGYLTFMGNEFGHPEWIDFPREGNDWSYHYARRQWSLVDAPQLKYHWLGDFDASMLHILPNLDEKTEDISIDEHRRLLSFRRGKYLFVFNFSPDKSYTDYAVSAPFGTYQIALDTDDLAFGGHNRIDHAMTYKATTSNNGTKLALYLPARTALVLCQI